MAAVKTGIAHGLMDDMQRDHGLAGSRRTLTGVLQTLTALLVEGHGRDDGR
jgi:hypothetical protein